MKLLTSIFLSLSLLVSTTGLSVLKHYCGGELAATQVLASHHNADKDGECKAHQRQGDCDHCKAKQHACQHSSGEKQQNKKSQNCCDNEVEQFKLDDNFVVTSLQFQTQLTAVTITQCFTLSHNRLEASFTPNLKHYLRNILPNSLVAPELRVSIQSFLI